MSYTHAIETNPAGQLAIYTIWQEGVLPGYLAVDSLVGGRCCGGVRLLPDIDALEMRGLARTMTLKYGFLGMPQGGAKAGVIGPFGAGARERQEKLKHFATALGPLLTSRYFMPGTDMGTNLEDIRNMLASVGISIRRRELRGSNSGYYTALSVFGGVLQGARHLDLPLVGSSAAIEGLGKVGLPLAVLLARAGVKVIAVSTIRGTLHNPAGLDVDRLQS
jgi:glutamate dehydrogenase (NAD(P)+)